MRSQSTSNCVPIRSISQFVFLGLSPYFVHILSIPFFLLGNASQITQAFDSSSALDSDTQLLSYMLTHSGRTLCLCDFLASLQPLTPFSRRQRRGTRVVFVYSLMLILWRRRMCASLWKVYTQCNTTTIRLESCLRYTSPIDVIHRLKALSSSTHDKNIDSKY